MFDDFVQAKLFTRLELHDGVVLAVVEGHVDLLVTDVRQLDRLLDEAAAPLRQGDASLHEVPNHAEVALSLDRLAFLASVHTHSNYN